ncbi:hypothetical protein LX81_00262 [Palleronia aestuarii]|uniref:Uncharacterized protein n=1 Tax=Palleronia aestuarii TaxID=568105 RepID=A0A2W7NIV3_9RHOB|nr:hypothetical protein [Palleronia aestuarii]PZX19800.1 hypothetical protein LX81_00262 [Palleronia aestuarii]
MRGVEIGMIALGIALRAKAGRKEAMSIAWLREQVDLETGHGPALHRALDSFDEHMRRGSATAAGAELEDFVHELAREIAPAQAPVFAWQERADLS